MLNRIKALLGRGEGVHWSNDAVYGAKSEAFAQHLGEAHDLVIAAVVGWDVGGPADLWVYPNHVPGSVLVTMQLATPGGTDQRRGSLGYYELAMATRHPPGPMFEADGEAEDGPDGSDPDVDAPDRELTPFGEAASDIRLFLTNLGRYTSMAVLEPGQTAEFPTEEMGTVYLVFDALIGRDAGVRVLGKPCGVLLAMRVHESELGYAREHGTPALLEKLREAGAYPYSDLDREPVV